MFDKSRAVIGADISHYQKRPDFGKLIADAVKFVIVKATQGMGTDPDFDWNRNEATKRGMLWLPYPFLTPNDNSAAVNHFCKVVGTKVPPAFDWEEAGTPAEDVEHWKKGCEDQLGRTGIAYYGKWPPEPVTDEIAQMPRWLPQYNTRPSLPAWDGMGVPSDWRNEWLIWQNTGTGRLPGIGGQIDLNMLACPFEVFKTWYETGELKAWVQAPASGTVIQTSNFVPPLVKTARVLHLHCSGDDVRTLQLRLAWLGEQVSADSDYGPQTREAVQGFQVKHGLNSDGVVGPSTLAAVNAAEP